MESPSKWIGELEVISGGNITSVFVFQSNWWDLEFLHGSICILELVIEGLNILDDHVLQLCPVFISLEEVSAGSVKVEHISSSLDS